MFCSNCGKKNLDSSLYCQECGSELSTSNTSPEPKVNYEESKENKDYVNKSRNKRRTAFYIIGGLVIVYFAFIIWGNPATPTSNTESAIINQANCNEQESINQAKNCTYLIYRDDDGYGSGFGIKPGFIVTNMHVVEGANKIVTYDSDEIPLTLWGYSEADDIAVLKSDKDTDNCIWANSDQLDVAETVYAVGWPYTPEGESSITKGIFSRTIKSEDDSTQFLQTDTAINPGNSGGPLINKCGVVGINFAKISWNDEATPLEGFGFALASIYSKPIIDKLISEGHPIKLPILSKQQTTTSTPKNNNQNLAPSDQTSFKLVGNELLHECPSFSCKTIQYGTMDGYARILGIQGDWYKVEVTEKGSFVSDGPCPPCNYKIISKTPVTTEGWFYKNLIPNI